MTEEQVIKNEIPPQDDGEFEEQEDWTADDEARFNGEEAGNSFADRHIFDKINLFVKVYREKGYSESFIEGFMDGINARIGANIYLDDSSDEEVDKQE